MEVFYKQEIAAPVETVFEFLDDDEKRKLWMEGLEQISYPDGQPAGDPVGTRFREVLREGGRSVEYEGEVLGYEKPRHLSVQIFREKCFTVTVDYRLQPTEAGTLLEYECRLAFGNIFYRVMGYLFGWLTKRILKKQMAKLKELAEAEALRPAES